MKEVTSLDATDIIASISNFFSLYGPIINTSEFPCHNTASVAYSCLFDSFCDSLKM